MKTHDAHRYLPVFRFVLFSDMLELCTLGIWLILISSLRSRDLKIIYFAVIRPVLSVNSFCLHRYYNFSDNAPIKNVNFSITALFVGRFISIDPAKTSLPCLGIRNDCIFFFIIVLP